MANRHPSHSSVSADYAAVIAAPFAQLGIRIVDGMLVAIDFVSPSVRAGQPDPLSDEIGAQLRAYLADPRFRFDLPLCPGGTPHQQRVWRAMQAIPSGRVKTYGALAAELGSGPRAVGGACHANPIPIVIPCHRVVAKSGLGGYMGVTRGAGLDAKIWLLEHERAR